MRLRVAFYGPLALALTGCGDKPAQSAPPPPIVDVVTLAEAEVPNILELPGRIASVRTAEVRARTDGIVLKRLYEEGQRVEEGTPLFQLDPRDYRAQVEQSRAALARYQATQTNAASLVERYTPLANRRAISAQELDAARSDLAQAQAQVAEAKATLVRSQLQLDYTTIRSPISGIVGQANVTEGALVSGGESTLLTRVDQISPVYATFAVSSTAVLDATRNVEAGIIRMPEMDKVEVRLVLENGEEYDSRGFLDFTSPVVDPSTGSQLIRASFANDARVLKPGQFVTGRVYSGTIQGGIVIPPRAVQMKGQQASVSLLSTDGTVATTPVTLGQMVKEGWIVKSGLKEGDRLIVDGWQKSRNGQKATARGDNAAKPSAGAPAAKTEAK